MSITNIPILSSLRNVAPFSKIFTLFKQNTKFINTDTHYDIFLEQDVNLEIMEMGIDKYHILYDTHDNIIEISTNNNLYKIQQLV